MTFYEVVKIYNEKNVPYDEGVGIFAGIFIKHFPLLPMEDEIYLHDQDQFENFRERIFSFAKSGIK